jgi:hypothetical protein
VHRQLPALGWVAAIRFFEAAISKDKIACKAFYRIQRIFYLDAQWFIEWADTQHQLLPATLTTGLDPATLRG